MKVVAGSYERYVWGWRLQRNNNNNNNRSELQSIFSYPAHLGPIKCIAALGPVLASGGTDDTIKIFDLNSQRDMGSLIMHKGAVTTLCFYGAQSLYPNNLLSGSEDGTICIWDTISWSHYKTMKGHKRGVSDLTIHPSGRLALSVGRDSHLNMYNLLKGRCTFTTKLPSEASLVKFAPHEGSIYSVCAENVVTIHNVEDGRCLHTLTHDKRVLCIAQQEDGVLFTGGEDCTLRAWDTSSGKLAFSIPNAHSNRIRGLSVLSAGQALEVAPCLVASASSDGFMRIWDTRIVRKPNSGTQSSPVVEADTKARLTCLVGCSLKKFSKKSLITNAESVKEDIPSKHQDGQGFEGSIKRPAEVEQLTEDEPKKMRKS